MYERVLFPTDGSQVAAAATEHAIELARRYDAGLTVLFVVDTGNPYPGTGMGEAWARVVDQVRQEGNQTTANVAVKAREEGVDADAVTIEHEDVTSGILAYADEHDVDAIVMGTHGRTGPRRWLTGSVAEGVVRGARVPVMVVPPGVEPEA